MDALGNWVQTNWFSLTQSLGIIFGLFFTALASSREAKSRQTGNILALTELHRDLWAEVHRRPDLQRVVADNADLVNRPISLAEEEFLNLVLVHFYTGWQLAKQNTGVSLEVLRKDVRSFFSRPIPRAVWENTKTERDTAFVRFVETSLAGLSQRGTH